MRKPKGGINEIEKVKIDDSIKMVSKKTKKNSQPKTTVIKSEDPYDITTKSNSSGKKKIFKDTTVMTELLTELSNTK